MKTLCLLLGLVLVAGVAHTAPPPPADSNSEHQVMAAEKARDAALEHSDADALDKIVADDVTYIHSSGRVDTKASYLAAIRSGQLHYISFEPKSPLHVRIEGNTGIVTGEYAVRVSDTRTRPDPFDISLFVLTVYARRDGRWQQIAYQSTINPAASPAK